jgi:hypothetical protein
MADAVTLTARPAAHQEVSVETSAARFGLHVRLVRRAGAGGSLEILLVSAVATLLGIRAYLAATGYPQVGGGGLHIAHMLWGGLLMLGAVVILLGFLGRPARRLAAVVGGAGFGTFVDELGKFITQDNDYFFRPTVGILYFLFVVLFLAFRAFERPRHPSREAALANAADALPELLLGGATEAERARVLRLLDQSGASDPLAAAARAFVAAAPPATVTGPSLATRLAAWGRRTYERSVSSRWFGRAVVFVFVATAVLGGAGVLLVVIAATSAVVAGQGPAMLASVGDPRGSDDWPVALVAALASLASLACSIAGALALRRSRLVALRWFRRSVLIALLLSQPIAFLNEQFGALFGLALNLVLWAGVGYLLRQETMRLEAARAA